MATRIVSSPMTPKPSVSLSSVPRLYFLFKNAAFAETVRLLLAKDFAVVVQNEPDAVQRITLAECDMVITDNVQDVLLPLRANATLNDLPVMMMLPAADCRLQIQALDSGANDVAVMPMDADVLKAHVRRHVKIKQQFDEQQKTLAFFKDVSDKKDRYLQIVTHDLKNPINNIRLAHYCLQLDVNETPVNKEALTTIEMAVQTMNDLINDFLDTAALEKGRTQLNLELITMEHLIWEVVSAYSEIANDKNITLLMGETEGEIMADPHRFMQVMSNLVSNAIKFSPSGRFVTISSVVKGGKVRLMVTDEGPGIPDHEQAALFEPFAKLSPRPTNGESSTGLGLSIVKELVLLHKGTVGVDSEENVGCTFWVEMPLYQPELDAIAV